MVSDWANLQSATAESCSVSPVPKSHASDCADGQLQWGILQPGLADDKPQIWLMTGSLLTFQRGIKGTFSPTSKVRKTLISAASLPPTICHYPPCFPPHSEQPQTQHGPSNWRTADEGKAIAGGRVAVLEGTDPHQIYRREQGGGRRPSRTTRTWLRCDVSFPVYYSSPFWANKDLRRHVEGSNSTLGSRNGDSTRSSALRAGATWAAPSANGRQS